MLPAGVFTRIVAILDRQAFEPHVWGKSDCLCDVAEVVAAITGTDYAASYRGRYTSYSEALALVRADGFSEPIDIVRAHFAEIHPLDAGDGDIGALPSEDGTLGFGIFAGDELFVKTEHGAGRLRRSRAHLAFRVS